jgi:nucleoside-diphosphate-sugar epimerase
MKTVCVTGGAGFIGSHVCERLLKDGYAVICIDNLLTGSRDNIKQLELHSDFQFIQHDVTKPLPVLPHVDYVFHLASPASPNHHSNLSYHKLPMETMMVNTQGTHNMLEFALQNNATFLFSSTSEVYGDPLIHPQEETYNGNSSTTGPRSVYDEAKRFGETLVAYYHRDKGLKTRIVRIFNTYGPRMQREDKRMIVNFILQALKNEPITLYGDGLQTRSLCYIDDLINGLMKFMFAEDLSGEIINIGNTDEHTVKEFAEIIKKATQSHSEIVYSEDLPKDDPLKRKPNITKAKKLLDWEPQVPIETGLQNTIDYFRK